MKHEFTKYGTRSQVIQLMLTGVPVGDACDQVGITREAYYRWLKDPDFHNEIEWHRSEMRNAFKCKLESTMGKVFETLAQDLDDPDWKCRHSASRLLIEALAAQKLTDIESKLAQLESDSGIQTININ